MAVINGTAFGGGFEFMFVCYYCVVVDNFRIKFGFFEVKFGLFFGGGGM